jgi:hypothetical protein
LPGGKLPYFAEGLQPGAYKLWRNLLRVPEAD